MKKMMALVLAGTMALSLTACGGSKDSASPASSDATTTSGAAASADSSADKAASDLDTSAYEALDPVELVLADSAAKGAAGSTFDQLVADKAAEITGGQLTIDTHLNGELGNDTDLLRQMQNGDIDIVGCQIAPMVSFIPELAIFDLPMVFAKYDGDKINEVLNGESETRAALDAAYEKAGMHLLGILQNGTYRLATANVNLQTLEDFKALQIRTMENSNHMAFWTAIGAEPTPLAWAEVYFALQSGTIDAQENAADTIVGANLSEVQSCLACTNHILYANQLNINKASWDALDPAYQAALEQAVSEAMEEMRTQLTEIDSENKKLLEDGGMNIINYEAAFFDEILALDGVQTLYSQINDSTNGLAQILQDELGK